MEIKIIMAVIMFSGIAFLCRVLVAFIKEAALANRNEARNLVVIEATSRPKTRTQKLERLKPANLVEFRLFPHHKIG